MTGEFGQDVAATVADWIILIEGYNRSTVQSALVTLSGPNGSTANGAKEEAVIGLYGLDFALEEREAKAIWVNPSGHA